MPSLLGGPASGGRSGSCLAVGALSDEWWGAGVVVVSVSGSAADWFGRPLGRVGAPGFIGEAAEV